MVSSMAGGCGSVPAACPCAQVALDVIEELCSEMGLQHPEAFDEYILFVVTDRGERLAGMAVLLAGAVCGSHAQPPGVAQGRACGR